MADGIKPWNEKAQQAAVAAGMKGGTFFTKPNYQPEMSFVDGWEPESKAKVQAMPIKHGPILDVWNTRRANGK